MSERLRTLQAKAINLSKEYKSVDAEWAGKDLPADVEKKIDQMLDDLVKVEADIQREQKALGVLDRILGVDDASKLPQLDVKADDDTPEVKEYRPAANHEIEMKAYRDWLSGNQGAEKYVSPELKAFHAYLHGDTSREVRQALRGRKVEEKVALNEGTASQGGYATPDIFADELVKALPNESYVRMAPRVTQKQALSDIVKLPTLSYTTAAVLTAEAAAYSEVEPTFGEQTFTMYKYTREVRASEEVLEDSRFDLWSEVILPDTLQAFAEAEITAFSTGTGSSQPEGVVTNAGTGLTFPTGNTTSYTADGVLDVYFALDFKYRNNATWMTSDAGHKALRKLKDSQNRYLLADNENNLLGAPAATLLGRPIITNPGIAVPAANAKSLLIGDFRYFYIMDRKGLIIKFAQELRAANGQVSWFVRKRFDSHNMLTAAFKLGINSAT
jgi:HK97 family phage major capsid protein